MKKNYVSLILCFIVLFTITVNAGYTNQNTNALYAPYLSTSPQIDGVINKGEYSLSPRYFLGAKEDVDFIPENWSGPEDLSGFYFLAWDKEYLYIATEVTDEIFVQLATGEDIWQGDHLEIWFDTMLDEDRNTKEANKDDFQLGVSCGDFAILEPELVVWTPPTKVDVINKRKLAVNKNENGYTIEVAIPWEILHIEPEPDMNMGFVFSISDTDTPGKLAQESMMSSAPGSSQNWGNPDYFGNLILIDPTYQFDY